MTPLKAEQSPDSSVKQSQSYYCRNPNVVGTVVTRASPFLKSRLGRIRPSLLQYEIVGNDNPSAFAYIQIASLVTTT